MSGIMKRKRSTPPSSPSPAKKPCPSRSEQLSVLHESWTPKDLKSYLRLCRIDDDVASRFEDNDVKGENLSEINDETLEKWNVSSGQRDEVLKIINNLLIEKVDEDAPQRLPKVFNDSVHGHIEVDPLLVRIIDTPQFQRLRDIKQLGAGYFVFPGASHNRFEHSIGVSHLAGCLVSRLRQEQPSLGINDVDVLCVKLAGLCHDLGHGPFSHVFDTQFIPMVDEDSTWKHEEASVKMLQHMIKVNKLELAFFERGITLKDVIFIEEMIDGPSLPGQDSKRNWKHKGRDWEKGFLYEIVANKLTGIDVDKWDYFARDCHHLGIANMFDYRRFMQFARVIEDDGTKRICTREKEGGNLYEMFHTRDILHRRVYQHITVKIIETMICEAFREANDNFFLPGKDGEKVKMSKAINDMEAYTHLTDRVFYTLLASTEKKLEKTRQILQAVQCRHLYPFVAQCTVPPKKTFSKDDALSLARAIVTAILKTDLDNLHVLTKNDVQDDDAPSLARAIVTAILKTDWCKENLPVLKKKAVFVLDDDAPSLARAVVTAISETDWCKDNLPVLTDNAVFVQDDAPSLARAIVADILQADNANPVLTKNDVFIHIVNFNYGKKDKDPIEHMYFYEKGNRDEAKTIGRKEVSHMLPEQFREQKIRLYIRDRKNQEKRKRAKSCFQEWCSKTEMIMGDGLLGILTPKKPSTRGRTTPTTSGSTTSEPTTSERNTRRKVDFSTK